MGGYVKYFATITSVEDLVKYLSFSKQKKLPLIIIGGGSNIIFPDDNELMACVALMKIEGITIVSENDTEVIIEVGAGVVWDDFVLYAVECRFSGVEALSAIPGSVGATPVQNVGAYGVEIKDVLISVTCLNKETELFETLTNAECNFLYRDSIFKHTEKYIIVNVLFKLTKKSPKIPQYTDVINYFNDTGNMSPSYLEIREAIQTIRWKKLPRPEEYPSCGSFFKNPIVEKSHVENIKKVYPGIVCYRVNDTVCKVGAGWLIDTVGLKGKTFGNLSLYKDNALVIVNNGEATKKELLDLILHIQNLVKDTFDIAIELEPIIIKDFNA